MNKLLAVFWDVDGTIADTELCGHRVAFNLAFRDFDLEWHWNEKRYINLLKISGGFIPTVRDVGTLVGGSPNKSCKDIFAFFAFQSQRAISIPAKAHAGIFRSLPLWWTSYIERFSKLESINVFKCFSTS